MGTHTYLLALGSNLRHVRYGDPRRILRAASDALEKRVAILARAPFIASAPVGPSQRRYANSAVLVETGLNPPDLLAVTQGIEQDFGRKRRGQPWRARTLDIDIILWSGGKWGDDVLKIPHPHFREREFVLAPAAAIAPQWREPVSWLTIRQLAYRSVAKRRAQI